MHNNIDTIKKIRKAIEFYRELGFVYMPVKKSRIAEILSPLASKPSEMKQHSGAGRTVNGQEALNLLRENIGDCQRCKLSGGRNTIVFGEGSPDAPLMFIGEGPGRDEDLQGRPFIGDAGKLLTKMIVKLGMKREDVYIANIVKCRPSYNRNPEEDEINSCSPFLLQQIEIIRPSVIVCLGKIATETLLGVKTPISKLRGNFLDFNGIPVMPTFHPAYLLRNPKAKWLTWDDMQKVMKRLT